MKSGAIPVARAHVQAALTLARQLDVEARALSQWTAAEVLAHDSDSTRALAWLTESRSRFERAADRWGVGQTWLTEARILAALERAGDAAEAARHAAEMLPESDEPAVLLARLALMQDDVDGADALVAPLRTQAAEKVRALIAAIRGGAVTRADAGEYLREHDAAPSQRSLRALTRIAASAPQFVLAREALAWMLLRTGRYEDAGVMFRALLSQALSPGDRASVMLGPRLRRERREGDAPPPLRDGRLRAPRRRAPGAAAPPRLGAPRSSRAPAPGSGAGASDAVFSGQLSSFALPDLLEFLRSRPAHRASSSAAARAGWARSASATAASPAARRPGTPGLGEFLVRAKKLSAEALRALAPADGAEQPDDVLAERIVRGGLADAGAMQEALAHQVWVAIRELVGWKDGEFAFSREEERRSGGRAARDRARSAGRAARRVQGDGRGVARRRRRDARASPLPRAGPHMPSTSRPTDGKDLTKLVGPEARQLPARAAHRARADGRRLPREGRGAAAPDRDQDPLVEGVGRAGARPGPLVPRRGAARRAHQPPARGPDLRRRAAGRHCYIAMEYVVGRSAEAMVSDGPVAPEVATDILLQAAAALHAAHRSGVIHRDVKPANLLVGAGGVTKLGDFGMALGSAEVSAGNAHVRVGTPYYTAPGDLDGRRRDARRPTSTRSARPTSTSSPAARRSRGTTSRRVEQGHLRVGRARSAPLRPDAARVLRRARRARAREGPAGAAGLRDGAPVGGAPRAAGPRHRGRRRPRPRAAQAERGSAVPRAAGGPARPLAGRARAAAAPRLHAPARSSTRAPGGARGAAGSRSPPRARGSSSGSTSTGPRCSRSPAAPAAATPRSAAGSPTPSAASGSRCCSTSRRPPPTAGSSSSSAGPPARSSRRARTRPASTRSSSG